MLWCDVRNSHRCVVQYRKLLITLTTCFHMLHLAVSDCNNNQGTQLTALESKKFLTSPNYGGNYDDNMLCKWLISTSKDYEVIRFEVLDLSIPESAVCGEDYVEIKDGSHPWSTSIKKYCGQGAQEEQTSSDPKITVVFKSDGQGTDRGFRMAYWAVPKGEVRYEEVPWAVENYILLGTFGLIVSSILITLASITTIRNVPFLYDKFLKGDVPPAKATHLQHAGRRLTTTHESNDTLCYSSRTVLESTSTLESPM